MIVFHCFEVFFSPYIVGFLHVAVIGSFDLFFPLEILLRYLMFLGHSFKSGGLRRGQKV